MVDPDAFVDLLRRRAELLAALIEEPRSRYVLVDEVSDSKTTAYKGVAQLLDAGLLEEHDSRLHPTVAGRVALSRYESLADAARLPDLLADIPPETLPPPALDSADVITPDSRSFDRHIVYGERILADAEQVDGIVPAVSDDTLDIFRERVLERDVEASLVLTDDLTEELTETISSLRDTPGTLSAVELWRTDAPIPFGLLVVTRSEDELMAIECYRKDVPLGLIVNDSSESIRWAVETVERYREGATTL
jgi:predicted transcriptional regulator